MSATAVMSAAAAMVRRAGEAAYSTYTPSDESHRCDCRNWYREDICCVLLVALIIPTVCKTGLSKTSTASSSP